MKQSKIVETIYREMPYSNRIRNVDLDSEKDAVSFEWGKHTFRVDGFLHCSVIEGHTMHYGGDITILMESLLMKNLTLSNKRGRMI